jgi:hypothetical protein
MIHIEENKCPSCLKNGLRWNLNICKSDMQMFKCGHGMCIDCYRKQKNEQKNKQENFSCPSCKIYTIGDSPETFSEWYSEYEIFIKAGSANKLVKNTSFGKQLLRLIKESRKSGKH